VASNSHFWLWCAWFVHFGVALPEWLGKVDVAAREWWEVGSAGGPGRHRCWWAMIGEWGCWRRTSSERQPRWMLSGAIPRAILECGRCGPRSGFWLDFLWLGKARAVGRVMWLLCMEKMDSSKVTWRETMTRREEKSRHRKPLCSRGYPRKTQRVERG
jgi:hypothetical protein